MALIALRRRIGALKPSFDDLLLSDYRNHPRYRDAVGHWIMNESGGLTAYDISGNRNHGTLTGGPVWTQGQFGPVLSFDGTDDTILDAGTSPVFTGDITISAWIFINAWTGEQIVDDRNNMHFIADAGNERIQITSDDSTTKAGSLTSSIAVGVWYHVVAVRPSNGNNCKFYIDGADKTSASVNSGTPSAGNGFAIGSFNGAADFFNGKIDDVRVYNRMLSADEVISLYTDPFLEFQQPNVYRWIERITVPVSIIPVRTTSPIYRPTIIGTRTI